MSHFCHLHCHTQYSLLDGAAHISKLMDKAVELEMPGIAITDHGNMFGAFEFVKEAQKRKLKPIVGCEFYLVEDRHKQQFSHANNERDVRRHQVLLAKNKKGYENLMKLCSLGFIEGLYGKYPRIDKELLEQYHEGLIATSCCIAAEIPQAIIRGHEEETNALLKWWLDLFGDDYYIELQRHHIMDLDNTGISQEDVNQKLLALAKANNIKVIATNDTHYINQEDAGWHDTLLCINTGELQSNPIGRGKGFRFGFPNDNFYLKSKQEMSELFADVPESIATTMEVMDKVSTFDLERDILLPHFKIPSGFADQTSYLRHLSFEGAKQRYKTISAEAEERLNFELGVIANMGFDGYFLITWDFIVAAKEMNVAVGPGRGSCGGSLVAYCLGITNIDPLKYNLIFERFLNPQRVSMPDMDIDFDDVNRYKVVDYVVEKYGREQVAQIITFGTIAARSSIRDVSRVMDLPLAEANRLAKLVPEGPKVYLKKLLHGTPQELKKSFRPEQVENVMQLRKVAEEPNTLQAKVLKTAVSLEGTVRNTGIHAAGVIITPDPVNTLIPVKTDKDSELFITQFEKDTAEKAGMLKFDFLGLKTLSIIKDCIANIKLTRDIDLDMETLPFDDPKTFELFQAGDMTGVFQFESTNMRSYLKELKPTDIEDLIAMNALYRPGPMGYIDNYIKRKHGTEQVVYPHELIKEILEPTFGIFIYQEQVMKAAQILADYTLGEADMLRRAMGKKKAKEMKEHKVIFMERAQEKGVKAQVAEGIYNDMAKFAEYAFNRSHSAAYAIVAYQTAYLKANYTAEFLAAVLTHKMNDTKTLKIQLDECRSQKIEVLGPNLNESYHTFTVNKAGQIRFGLCALKGVGEGPVDAIVEARKEGGDFNDVLDFVERVDLHSVNKKTMESLILGGALDCFEDVHRAQYFEKSGKFETALEGLLKYGSAYKVQMAEASNTLFGDSTDALITAPQIPNRNQWQLLEKLQKEKEVTGIYISGHPLDQFHFAIKNYVTAEIGNLERLIDQDVILGVMVNKSEDRISKRNTKYGIYTVSDFSSEYEIRMFKDDYYDKGHYFKTGECLLLYGKYSQRYRDSKEYAFKITKVLPMALADDQLTKSITLMVSIDFVSDSLVEEIEKICKKKKGPHALKVVLFNPKEKYSIPLISGNRRVLADAEFVEQVVGLGMDYRLN